MTLTLNLNLSDATQDDVQGAIAMLQAFDGRALKNQAEAILAAEHKEATRRPIPSQLPVAVEPEMATMTGATPVMEAQRLRAAEDQALKDAIKPKRKKKDAVAAEPVDPQSVVAAGSDQYEVAESCADNAGASSPHTADTANTYTLDELRAHLQHLTETKGMQAGIDMLNKTFGVARITELASLPVERQAEFVAACNA